MAFLTSLADVARSAGLTIREVSGWKTRAIYTDDTIDPIKAVMWHHTATKASDVISQNNPTLDYMVDGLGYPLCNLALAWDGSVDVVAAGAAGHAGKGAYGPTIAPDQGNWQAIGIEVEGTTGLTWSTAQLEAAARLGKALSQAYGTGIAHIGHLEYAPGRKVDPSGIPGGMSALRSAINRGYWATPDKEEGEVPSNNNGPVGLPVVSHTWLDAPHQGPSAKKIATREVARNRAFNGSFEVGTLGWVAHSRVEGFTTVDRGDIFPWLQSGTKVARFECPGLNGYIYHGPGYTVDTVPGRWYAARGSIRTPKGVAGRLRMQFYDANGRHLSAAATEHRENDPPEAGMEYLIVNQAPEGAVEVRVYVWPPTGFEGYAYAAGIAISEGESEDDALAQLEVPFDGDTPDRYATAEEAANTPGPTTFEPPFEEGPTAKTVINSMMQVCHANPSVGVYERNSTGSNVIAWLYQGAKVFALYRPGGSNYIRVAWGNTLGYMPATYLVSGKDPEWSLDGRFPRGTVGDGWGSWPEAPLDDTSGWHDTNSHNAWARLLLVHHGTADFTVNLQLFLRDQGTYGWPLAIDGELGYYGILGLQQFLANEGYLPDNPLWVDGVRGAGTIRAEKTFLNDQRQWFLNRA